MFIVKSRGEVQNYDIYDDHFTYSSIEANRRFLIARSKPHEIRHGLIKIDSFLLLKRTATLPTKLLLVI